MNLLTDLPEMAIATDGVDPEMTERPRRWDIRDIRDFMLVFGAVSSLFDFATFGVLLLVLHATPEQFRTGWFVESVISASVIVLVIRTRRPFFASRPGRALLASTILVGVRDPGAALHAPGQGPGVPRTPGRVPAGDGGDRRLLCRRGGAHQEGLLQVERVA